MRHCSFPFSTLWLFISFSILIINGANFQPVLFFSSSLFYLTHYSLFLCNHKRIALLLLCSVPYSFQWYRVLYTSILPDFPCCWRTPLCAAPSILLLCLQRYGQEAELFPKQLNELSWREVKKKTTGRKGRQGDRAFEYYGVRKHTGVIDRKKMEERKNIGQEKAKHKRQWSGQVVFSKLGTVYCISHQKSGLHVGRKYHPVKDKTLVSLVLLSLSSLYSLILISHFFFPSSSLNYFFAL